MMSHDIVKSQPQVPVFKLFLLPLLPLLFTVKFGGKAREQLGEVHRQAGRHPDLVTSGA